MTASDMRDAHPNVGTGWNRRGRVRNCIATVGGSIGQLLCRLVHSCLAVAYYGLFIRHHAGFPEVVHTQQAIGIIDPRSMAMPYSVGAASSQWSGLGNALFSFSSSRAVRRVRS
jgi:hypothetical protein